MAEIVLDKAACTSYNAQLKQELDNYSKVVNEVGTQAGQIAGAWQGTLADDFINQFNAFLPNLTIGFNIIEKSDKDLTTVVNTTTATDERAGV